MLRFPRLIRAQARRAVSFALHLSMIATPMLALSQQAYSAELTIVRSGSVATLDPGFLREPATVVDNIFDTMVSRDPQMKLAPGLALSWKAIDPTTWEFKLRPNVKFTDGEPFDAAAVKFSIDRILDPNAHAPTISYISTIQSVEVVDPLTVRIHTKGPDALLPTRMSRYPAYIVPPKYLAKEGPAVFARQPIGTGPYIVTSFLPDEKLVMKANPDYWGKKPSIDQVVWKPVPESSARLSSLLAGEAQLVEGVSPELAPVIQRTPNAELVRVKNGGLTIYLGLKTQDKPLNDVRVRQALALAIDRNALANELLRGFATATATQVAPNDFGYKAEPIPAPDITKAKQLLAEAGYPNGFTIRMQAPSHYISSQEVGEALSQRFASIGVKVTLEVPEWSVYTQQVASGKQAPIYLLGWGSTQTLDADAAIYPILHSGQPYSTVSIPEIDKLLDDTRQSLDPAKRAIDFAALQDLMLTDVPLIPLYREDALYAKSKNLEFVGRPDARIVLDNLRFK